MAVSDIRTTTYRAPGIARRARLLAVARELLATRELDVLTLADVAAKARIPKGSAYHYYRDIMDLYGHLLVLIEDEMLDDVRRPLRQSAAFESWADVVAALIRRGARYFDAHPAARQLILSPKAPPELKRRDRQSDVRIGVGFEEHIDARFALPERPDRSAIFFRAVEIADLMFSLSMLEHGRITDEMTTEAIRAVTGYLRCHFPASLPARLPPDLR